MYKTQNKFNGPKNRAWKMAFFPSSSLLKVKFERLTFHTQNYGNLSNQTIKSLNYRHEDVQNWLLLEADHLLFWINDIEKS